MHLANSFFGCAIIILFYYCFLKYFLFKNIFFILKNYYKKYIFNINALK